jgi:outer membrane protein assembly factor BamA
VFSNPSAWRPNPLIDDGHYTLLQGRLDFDTRNNLTTPTSGWYIQADWEHGMSSDVAPAPLPPEVRDPASFTTGYGYSRLAFDVRRYARINALARVNLRMVGSGWIGGDPLPVQRRVSLGGPGLLPGYAFRSQTCAPPGYEDPSQAALCDRMLAVQGELRYRFHLGLRERLGAQDLVLLERLIGAEQADVVLFTDMGKAWLSGDGPGRVPNDKLPVLREWQYDVGLGLDLDGIAVYLATPVGEAWAPRVTFRLQRRF